MFRIHTRGYYLVLGGIWCCRIVHGDLLCKFCNWNTPWPGDTQISRHGTSQGTFNCYLSLSPPEVPDQSLLSGDRHLCAITALQTLRLGKVFQSADEIIETHSEGL